LKIKTENSQSTLKDYFVILFWISADQ